MTGRSTPRPVSRPLEAVVRRLRLLSLLSEAELDILRGLDARSESHAAGDELIAEGAVAAQPAFILSGWACRQRVLPDGRRQIFGFLLPGEGFALDLRYGPELSTVTALTALETIDAEPVLDAVRQGRAPGLGLALAAVEAIEQKQFLDHMVRLGRQSAYERVAHFLLDLQRRLEITGLGDSQRFPLPLTQEVMADALGLSIVHVNRTLQQLRRERLIELRSGVTILLQREQLASIADFQPPLLRVPASVPAPGGSRAEPESAPRA